MSEANEFLEFIRRIRAGDALAAEELVRKYEAAIRMEVRLRLSDPRLRRAFDSMDVCQSVLGSFFARAAAGQYDLEEPRQLLNLLVAMARNKVAMSARAQRQRCRDHRRNEAALDENLDVAGPEASPPRIVAGRELLEEVRRRLSAEERRLADLRADGREWAAIAEEMGGTAQARRKQLARALNRVLHQLGLDDDSSGPQAE
jgi:RNA polymerase sigma factor (sigma-70 family)